MCEMHVCECMCEMNVPVPVARAVSQGVGARERAAEDLRRRAGGAALQRPRGVTQPTETVGGPRTGAISRTRRAPTAERCAFAHRPQTASKSAHAASKQDPENKPGARSRP